MCGLHQLIYSLVMVRQPPVCHKPNSGLSEADRVSRVILGFFQSVVMLINVSCGEVFTNYCFTITWYKIEGIPRLAEAVGKTIVGMPSCICYLDCLKQTGELL